MTEKKFCPKYSTSFVASQEGNKLVFKARCKQWSCPYCAKVNQRIWRARIMGEVESTPDHSEWYFWTVTLAPGDHKGNMVSSALVWRNVWDKLMKRIRRNLGKLRYVRVFEPHKSGILHVHMLTDKSYSDVERVVESDGRDNYTSETFRLHLLDLKLGVRHDIRPIITSNFEENGLSRNVSAYVTKYLTKDIQSLARQILRDNGLSRIRIIQTSSKWFNQAKKEAQLSWDNRALTLTELLYGEHGTKAIDISKDRVITSDDFYDYDHYPNKLSDLVDMVNDGFDS